MTFRASLLYLLRWDISAYTVALGTQSFTEGRMTMMVVKKEALEAESPQPNK